MRILHLAMLVGLVVSGGTLILVRRLVTLPAMGDTRILTPVLAGIAGVVLMVAWLALRARIPARRSEQTADAYWGDASTRGAAIVLWAAIEGAGVIAAVGVFLTGGTVTATAFALALGTLVLLGPGRLQGDDAL